MFEVGDKVQIIYPKRGTIGITGGMSKYNRMTARVSRLIKDAIRCGYELEGVKSAEGVSYTFVEEWLFPADESEGNDETD